MPLTILAAAEMVIYCLPTPDILQNGYPSAQIHLINNSGASEISAFENKFMIVL